jgi:hypothetical protein
VKDKFTALIDGAKAGIQSIFAKPAMALAA